MCRRDCVLLTCSSVTVTCDPLCEQSALEVYTEMLLLYLEEARRQVNSHCAPLEPWQIIGASVAATLGAVWIKGVLFQRESKPSP